ncbi:hypothetical protein [Enterococcus wangshanyuanii]|uniref:Fibronectin type-III domain-containing protein n=1 Tax=Enterococcus wangshanyuanii TaxID=2005703 RepID=A0ABQ1PBH7_9ENTE|nr:hypothetical protein [Enterococcus wangshanyuanii]GGC92945.1 hypothetical protein GCM10011573_23190 [Enterococcus wangshanyuanii]
MKKNVSHVLIYFLIMLIFPSDWSYALEAEPIQDKEETVTEETSGSSEQTDLSSELAEIDLDEHSEESSENSSINKVENKEINDKNLEEFSSEDVELDQPKISRAVTQADDDFWLVDSAATLTEYLKDSQKLKFRLTNDLNLGTAAFQLKSGMIIDGDGYTITYDKGGTAARGFYTSQADAVIEIRNTQFGTPDGSGAIGYYGIVTGSATNVTLIYDSISYYSNNGQMIYNPNGSVIMRGNNTIDQKGTSTYSQEWAEINYVEIENGQTTIEHSSNQTSAFIWSTGTASGNPHANTSQIVVRENAKLDIKTNSNMTYGTLAPSYIVEKNAVFNLDKVSLATGGTRNQFFYSSQTQPVNFSFQENAKVNFTLPLPINLNTSKGGMAIGKDAEVSIDVASGAIFTTGSSSSFAVTMDHSKKVAFSSTSAGTLGLNGASGVKNLGFTSDYLQKVETFATNTAASPTHEILKQASDLSVQGANFTNLASSPDPFDTQEIAALKGAQKIVFSAFVDVADQLKLTTANETATSITLKGTSFNNGSPASKVKFYLFTSAEDLNQPDKAKHILSLDSFDDQQNTMLESAYQVTATMLNPNTNYWAQMVVVNQAGQSQFSESVLATTKPQLESLEANVTTTSAVIEGVLSSNTGYWTDYSSGEESGVGGQVAYYGGSYQQVRVEYSTNKEFPTEDTSFQLADLSGDKNQLFRTKLKGLKAEVTYYVRVRVIGLSGEEVVLALDPLTQFTTIAEIINVEVPIEMDFQTRNKDLGTAQEGQITSPKYQVVNKGNTPTKITLTDLTKENSDADQLQLLNSLSGTAGMEELSLKLLVEDKQISTHFLTSQLASQPQTIGELNPSEQQSLSLEGKYFNPTSAASFPQYKLTFKVEKNEE